MRKGRKIGQSVFVVSSMLSLMCAAHAEESGATLLSLCEPKGADFVVELTRARECIGYIAGTIDSNLYWKTIYGIDSWCFPRGESVEQARLAAVAWLKENQGQLHLPAVILLNKAFAETFPCAE